MNDRRIAVEAHANPLEVQFEHATRGDRGQLAVEHLLDALGQVEDLLAVGLEGQADGLRRLALSQSQHCSVEIARPDQPMVGVRHDAVISELDGPEQKVEPVEEHVVLA